MFGYTMEQFEIMNDAMEEVAEWEAYEKDMESNPFGTCYPTAEEMEQLSKIMTD